MADSGDSTGAGGADGALGGKQFTRQELESRNRREDALFVIDNVVYDVTQFLEEHPGGPEVLLDNAGRDASQCFHDVGHSEEARAWMTRFAVGSVVAAERRPVRAPAPLAAADREPLAPAALLHAAAPPLLLALLAYWLHSYLFS